MNKQLFSRIFPKKVLKIIFAIFIFVVALYSCFEVYDSLNIVNYKKIITIEDIDNFIWIYEKDFNKDDLKKFRKEFLSSANNFKSIIGKKNADKFLKLANPDIADKFKILNYSTGFDLVLEFDGKISFKKETNPKKIKRNLKRFDKIYDNISWMQDKKRAELFSKLREEIEEGNISFKRGLDKKTSKLLFNLCTFEIDRVANIRKNHIIYTLIEYNLNPEASAKNMGIEDEFVKNMMADLSGYTLAMEYFIDDYQYETLGDLSKLSAYNENDVKKIESKLNEAISYEQKKVLKKLNTNTYYLAKNLIKRGKYTKYDFAYAFRKIGNENNATFILTGEFDFSGKENKPLSKLVYETKYIPNGTTNALFKNSMSKLLFADINTQHSQIIDVVNVANNKYKMPNTVVNFDSHSDISIEPRYFAKTAEIGDWANYVLSIPNVDKFVWVFPNNILANNPDAYYSLFSYYPYYSDGMLLNGDYDYTIAGYDYKKPLVQKFYYETDKMKLTPVIGSRKPKNRNIKIIELVMCHEHSIPDFKGEEVFLSIDGDYFNNSGVSTRKITSLHPYDINKSFADFAVALKKANFTPKFLSCSMSPEYVTYEKYGEVYGFFKYLLKVSNKQDTIKEYVLKLGDKFTKDDYVDKSEF